MKLGKLHIDPKVFMKFPKPVAKIIGRTGLKLKKWMPEILTAVGIGTSLAATVTACKATTELEPILDRHKEAVDDIHAREFASEKEQKAALTKAYLGTGKKLAKLYALPAALEGVSIACQIGSTKVLRKENKALTAAYMGLLEAYRSQHNGSAKKDGSEGEETAKEQDTVSVTNALSPYAIVFDKKNGNWRRRASDNKTFLICKMNEMNDLLHARGHVFLNEVYDNVGMPRTEAGQLVGWVDGMGDSFIDFNMVEGTDADGDNVFWIDFNVDGSIMYIFDKMFGGDGKNTVPFVCNN